MRRFGLDYAAAGRRSIPALIYASISGYGQTGPDAPKGGFDLIAQGVSGLMSVTGRAGRPAGQVRRAAHRSRRGAVRARRRSSRRCTIGTAPGAGQYIDTSLVEAGLALSVWEAGAVFRRRRDAGATRIGASLARAVSGDSLRRRIHHDRRRQRSAVRAAVRLLGHPEWPTLPAFADATARVANRAALIAARSRRSRPRESRAALARAARGQRHPVRSDQRLRRGLRRSAGPRARDGRARSTIPRSAGCARSARRSRCRRRRRPSGAARRCSASTRARCCAKPAIPKKTSRVYNPRSFTVSDRKYKQRGYQDDGRERPPRPPGRAAGQARRPEREPGAPAGARRISSEGARNPNMPGFHDVARCARCGSLVDAQIFSRSKCAKCQQDLRSCTQCAHFDPGARFECTQAITARMSPKDIDERVPVLHRHERRGSARPHLRSVAVRLSRRAHARRSTTCSNSEPEHESTAHGSTRAVDPFRVTIPEWRSCRLRTNRFSSSICPRSTSPSASLLFTQTIAGSESGIVAKQVLDELAHLNDKITVVEKNFILDLDDRARYGVDKSPAIVVLSDGKDTRMRFYGAPTGYEFVPLVEAVLLAGTGNRRARR